MKRSKKTTKLIGLACVLVAACCVTVGVMKHEEKKEQIQNSDEVILQIPADTVTALAWDNGTTELAFHKEDGWVYDEDHSFPVNEDKIMELLSLFENFGVSFEIDDVEDYGLYGLDEPVCTIRITTTEQFEDMKTTEEIAEEQNSEEELNSSDGTATDDPEAVDPEDVIEEEPDVISETGDNDVQVDTADVSDDVVDAGTEVEEEESSIAVPENDAVTDQDPAFEIESEEDPSSTFEEREAEIEATIIENDNPTEDGTPDETAGSQDASETSSKPVGNTYEIRLGDFSTMDAKRYVSIGDGKVYLVSDDPLDLFDAVLRDMIDHDDDLSYTSISEIQFTGNEAYSIVYQEDSIDTICSEDVYFTQRDGKTVPLDTERVGGYLNNLTTLNPINYVNYKVTEEDLIDYGLDEPELTVSVDYTKSEEDEKSISDTFVIHISRNRTEVDAANDAAKKAEAENDEDYIPVTVPAYIRIGDSKIIYEITDDQYQSLMAASYNDLRHQELFAADFESVTEISVTLENNNYTLSSAPDEEDEDHIVWLFNDTEINITYLQEALEHLQAYEFTDEAATDKEEISLTVHLSDPNHPEIEIILYRYDGDDCLAKVNGEIFALVDRSDVVDLIEAVHAIVLN